MKYYSLKPERWGTPLRLQRHTREQTSCDEMMMMMMMTVMMMIIIIIIIIIITGFCKHGNETPNSIKVRNLFIVVGSVFAYHKVRRNETQ
jgi:hypothetical protein